MQKTVFVPGEGLKIPVIDMSLDRRGKYLSEPETLRNSILELLFEPEELASLVIVKPNPEADQIDPLAQVKFADNIPRRVAFSSGKNIYFADAQLSQQLIQFFHTQPDHACRYGSLLVSSCNEGASLLDSTEDNQPLRIKIVNCDSKDPKEIAEAQQFRTGDCHGKISPQLAKMLGGKSNRPFQFRFAWMQQWRDGQHDTPEISFLAKGTLLPDKSLTEDQGYDLILDKSSIKGIVKEQLDDLIPCGDYELPKAILGNRGNAKIQEYENSWQLSIWYSEAAIRQDIAEPTKIEAQKLAQLQQNPLKLARYLVEQYDRKAAYLSQSDSDETQLTDAGESEQPQASESRLISLLRNDKYGQILDFPKITDFLRTQIANRWRDLAIKGSVCHSSAMAQPDPDLKPGTIVAPHLSNGEEVLVTRYPIVSKDNIRRYTVDNCQKPELLPYRGCVFIRPDQAMQHHQCDFDGDQLVVTPASQLPHIAAETRHANQEREFAPVQKREKVDYTSQYPKLRQIAAAIPKNKIGIVATTIGRVQSSVPRPGEPARLFRQKQGKLLGKLFDALQIEVDSPKSAARLEAYHPTLLAEAQQWSQDYPSHFFDYKNDPRLYKTMPLPTSGDNAINAIAREAVNPAWEPTRLRSRHRDEFRYLFPPPENRRERQQWEEYYLPWAQELKERFVARGREIHQQYPNDSSAVKEAYGKLYEDLRGEVNELFSTAKERKLAMAALGYLETASPNLNEPRQECAKLSRQLKVTFHLERDHQWLHEAIPQDTYILSVPFERYVRDENGRLLRDSKKQPLGEDFAGAWKEALDRKEIQYEATLDPNLPLVRFALLEPSEKLVEVMLANFGENDNFHLSKSDLSYVDGLGERKSLRIVPPADYHWLESAEEQTPKSALVLNLFAEELCTHLQQYQFDRAELIGQKYNDFPEEDFGSRKWQGKTVKLAVSAFDKPEDRRHGFPIVQLEGKNLAMFSVNSPKLPIGATFDATISPAAKGSALHLKIDPESVRLPETSTSVQLPQPETLQVSPQQLQSLKLDLKEKKNAACPHLNHRHQDLLDVSQGIIVQQVNCQGKMGRGLAGEIAQKFPQVKTQYQAKADWQLGDVQLVKVEDNLYIANVAGQDRYGTDSRQTNFEALRDGLRQVNQFAQANGNLPIYLPNRLGSGLAGGRTELERRKTWQTVQGIIAAECPQATICHLTPETLPENQSRPPHQPTNPLDPSQVLHQAIAECYQKNRTPKIRMTENWTAFVNCETSDCFVRDKQRKIVFHSNLNTGQIHQPLSDSQEVAFLDCILKESTESKQRPVLLQKLHQKSPQL